MKIQLKYPNRSYQVSHLYDDIVPLYCSVEEILEEPRKYVVLDTRLDTTDGLIEDSVSFKIPSDWVNERKISEIANKFADICAGKPSDAIYCLSGYSGPHNKLVHPSIEDHCNKIFLFLARFAEIPRLCIVRGGFRAFHDKGLVTNHSGNICRFCEKTQK
jgi:hypothetical protein